jgi:hypothetical protein
MSWEEYARHSRTDPYILELSWAKGDLVYYGAFHKVDDDHPQFEDIEQRWNTFNPDYALCEGNEWPLAESRCQAIRLYGEQGLLTYLAARDGIPVECIDPPIADQVNYLKNHFRPQQIKVYFVLRQAAVNRMLKKNSSRLRYVYSYLDNLGNIPGFRNSPTNLIEFEHTVSQMFPEIDCWTKIPYSYFHDQEKGGFLAKMHRMLNKYRDRIMIKKVVKALKKGKRVFAVVGRSHVVIQEASLRSLGT